MSSERERQAATLYRQLQMCAAGHSIAVSWEAASDHFAAIIGFAANDMRQAEQLCDTAAEDMKRAIRSNWSGLRDIRARTCTGGG